MAMETNFGFRPLTTPKEGQTDRKLAGATVLRHSIVYLATDGDVEMRPDGATTQIPYGVALNYATVGEEVIICIDPNMKYVTTYNIGPNILKQAVGYYAQTVANDTAMDAMNPHIGQGSIGTIAGTYVSTTHAVQILGIYEHPENPYGDFTSTTAVDLLVTVRVISKLAEIGA